jgi:hypothetical protein
MPRDVTMTFRRALAELQSQRQRIDRQIEAIQAVLGAGGRRGPGRRGRRPAGMRRQGRRRMSAAARRAVSQRMRAYWAKRRATGAKAKTAAK